MLSSIRETTHRLILILLLTAPLLAGAGGSWGCGRDYSQASPDEVLRTAREMVEHGDAHRLPDLIYADSREMRQLLTEFGKVLASIQSLAVELNRAFPEEVEEIKAQAAATAERGNSSGLLGRMLGGQMQARGRARRQSPTGGVDQRQAFDQSMQELFADPYGWLARSEGRITTQYVADDMSEILWDNKPVFGVGVGILMKQERGKWYIMLPTGMPGLGQIAPRSEETWKIGTALARVFDNAIKDTQREVRAGEHASMEDLARSVGEKAFLPAAAIAFAYQRALRVEREEERERQRQAREEAQRKSDAGNSGS